MKNPSRKQWNRRI